MKVKAIKVIKAKDGSLHTVGLAKPSAISAEYELTCMAITHRRDGETGLYKAERDEARYEIVYADPEEQKPIEVHVIPQRELASLVFVIEEKEKKKKTDGEADVVMDKA